MVSLEITTEVIEQPPSWHQSVYSYLDSYNLKCRKATPLQGGASTYIWKIEGLTKHDSGLGSSPVEGAVSDACVLKYADGTVKAVPALKLPHDRMLVEARAMQSQLLAHVCAQEPSVEIPQLVHQTDEAVLMSWAGDRNLRTAYIDDQSLDAKDVGRRLGRWIATLHLGGIDCAEVRDWDNPSRDSVLEREKNNLHAKLSDDAHFNPEDIKKAMAVYDDSTVTRTLTPWDFRPMNTLLRPGVGATHPRITVVDWEIACYGDPAFDIRLWAAEAIVLESQHGQDRGLLASFLTAYRQRATERVVDFDFVCRVAILIAGIWELLMPCSIWDIEEEDAASWRNQAHEYARAGINGDREWLLQSRLGSLLQ